MADSRLLPWLGPWSMDILWRRRIVGDRCARTLLSCRRSSRAQPHAESTSRQEATGNPWSPVVAMTTHSPISLPLLISSNNRTSYDRHPLLWSAGMMARALIVRIYSLRLVWRRGGRWRALADCWQSERRDRPMSGRACYHGVTQQLLCCGQGLWSASGSGTSRRYAGLPHPPVCSHFWHGQKENCTHKPLASLTHSHHLTNYLYLSSFSVHHATILSVQELAYVSLQLVIIHRHDCWRH